MTTRVESTIVACGPAIQAGYRPGEQVKLQVMLHTHGWRDHWYDDWQVILFYDVYGDGEVPIIVAARGPVLNFEWWNDYEEEWDSSFTVSLGTMPDESWQGEFRLWCGSPPLGTLDTAPFYIPLRGVDGNGNGNGDGDGEPAKTPWKWIAVGGAIVTAAVIIANVLRRRR